MKTKQGDGCDLEGKGHRDSETIWVERPCREVQQGRHLWGQKPPAPSAFVHSLWSGWTGAGGVAG